MVTPAKEAVPNDDRVFELYQQIAEAVTIPIVLQDHPAINDVHMSAALILRVLRALPGIACVKEEAVPTAPKIRQLREGLTRTQRPDSVGPRRALRAVRSRGGLRRLQHGVRVSRGAPGAGVGRARRRLAARASPLFAVCRADRVRAAAGRRGPQGDPPAPRAADIRPRAASGRLRFGGAIGAARRTARAHAARRRHHEADPDRGTGGIPERRDAFMKDIDTEDIAERTRRRITRRLMPFLFVLYVFNYLNRVNVGYAALQMTERPRFLEHRLRLRRRDFFHRLFPAADSLHAADRNVERAQLHHHQPGRLGRAWRRSAASSTRPIEFYWVRFFLGIAQAGFFPGVIMYLTHWFRYEDRAKTIAMFMMAIPTSNMVGAAISAPLMRPRLAGLERLAVAADSRRDSHGDPGHRRVLLPHGPAKRRAVAPRRRARMDHRRARPRAASARRRRRSWARLRRSVSPASSFWHSPASATSPTASVLRHGCRRSCGGSRV